ncbi:bifunctional acetate--CoA ligase family protein/GNAT family N-acetyltransferase [Pusillimonas sp.]|uniref:bifunctional acetate--CoA ligase family protein/GNAT family N-acetyltransferase n=1 Tax=Pusillimonas sp. TaxID=3040095 RepID=UPI0029B86BA7|nr:bifunctional acetate--CoA ligase family protein/GNAT family N-acetyltransferase [Pusillimonas sp.]MDX3893207.1 bifunctional acetate--CoA ligase family protein/GNAT family N-acetyltransferase [Pusillimonas sp.]
MSIRNLEYLFNPRSVAVIGATDRPGRVGSTVMRNLMQGGFAGPILPINPKYDHVAGLPAFHDLSQLTSAPDLAVLCTPPSTVPGLIAQLGRMGTKAAIVLTAGSGILYKGKTVSMQQAMLEEARPYLLRILGPNCIGLIIPGINLNASFAGAAASSGKIAFVSQSGALTTGVLDWAASKDIGFSKFISVGNSADVDFGDVLDYLASDPDTRSILLYIESIKFARKFMSAARAAARNKPVIVVKAGRSAAGALAATSHTGAMAGTDAVFDAAIRRAGMLRVDTTQDLFSAIETLSRAKPLHGDDLVILTNGGGPGVMAADALSLAGETPAALSDETRRKLDAILPAAWSKGNPIDIIGDAPTERYVKTLSTLLDDGKSGAVLFIHAPTAIVGSEEIARECAPLIAAADRCVLGCWLGGRGLAAARQVFSAAGIPTYQTPEEAVQAFLHLLAYRRNQALLLEVPSSKPLDFGVDTTQARDVVENALKSGRGLLNEIEAKSVLAAYGVPVVPTRAAATVDEAVEIAQHIGFPVVLKILSPDISHKSDVEGVALNLRSMQEMRTAAQNMLERIRRLRPGAALEGFSVQAMVDRPRAHELILGVANDKIFGPVIMFGHGGTAAELINDRAVSLPPLNLTLARNLVAGTRIFKLLQGYRDRPPADLHGLYLILIRLSQLLIDIPEIIELDVNPLLLDEHGAISLDARIHVAPSSSQGSDRLAIRPYPKELEEILERAGQDGPAILLRPILPSDWSSYQHFLQSLSPDDVRNRFFCALRQLPESELARVTQIDYSREMTLVLVSRNKSPNEEIIGEIRLVTDPDNRQVDMGIAVSTAYQAKGLGSALLSKAIRYCRERGTAHMTGTVQAGNAHMLNLARKFGFRLSPPQGDVIDIFLRLNPETEAAAWGVRDEKADVGRDGTCPR